ncbi:MAG: DUF58 domain-containing protein, partial [Chitinophagales bacterium]
MAKHLESLDDIHEIDKLEFLAKQVVEGFIIGLHKSPYHGFSVEFAEHRLYNKGESVRNIDWKVYARTNRLYVKRYEEETNLRCQIVLDASPSMYFPRDQQKNKINFSIVCAAAMFRLMKKQRDAVGLSVFRDKVEVHTKAKSTQVHQSLLTSYLEQYLNLEEEKGSTSAADALHQIADSIHQRSLVVIFSDMFDSNADNDALFSALQHLKYNKHEVILFHVVDKRHELDFEFENRPYEFVDIESGEKLKLQANEVRSHYKEQIKAFEEALKLKCAQYRIEFVEADINKGFRQVLLPYLMKR